MNVINSKYANGALEIELDNRKQLRYLLEVLEKFSWVIKIISMLGDLKFLQKVAQKIIELLLEDLNKDFALPWERYLLQKDI